jgi:trehalose 6-phosphate phosphatase
LETEKDAMSSPLERINERLTRAERLWLFLDYDGTLADLAPTPDHVHADPELVDLITRLAEHPCIRVTVVSGRRLRHVEALVPVPGILLAGTYGVELRTPDGRWVNRVEYHRVRPVLDAIKPRWLQLVQERAGLFLEDKGWALALHARFAGDDVAKAILNEARRAAHAAADSDSFRVLGGYKFLEVGPKLAHKGRTVAYLLDEYPLPGAQLFYLGDDDKDEEAFDVIREQGGTAILVSSQPRATKADYRLESPQDVRHWLEMLPLLLARSSTQTSGQRKGNRPSPAG